MRQASKRVPESAEKTVRDICRATRRHHSAEEKIRVTVTSEPGKISASISRAILHRLLASTADRLS